MYIDFHFFYLFPVLCWAHWSSLKCSSRTNCCNRECRFLSRCLVISLSVSSSGTCPSLYDQCSMLSNLCRLCNFYLEHVILNHDVIFISNITGFFRVRNKNFKTIRNFLREGLPSPPLPMVGVAGNFFWFAKVLDRRKRTSPPNLTNFKRERKNRFRA